MSNNTSVLKFNRYIVKKVEYITNEEYVSLDEEVELPFEFESTTTYDNNHMEIELGARIFKNAVEKNYPFEMYVCLKGFFEIETSEDIRRFERNAIAILFPYLRAVVSTYTANANVAPVLLPAMNINEYLRKKYETPVL